MKNITFSADEHMIQKARERARSEKRTLNDAFREWISRFAGQTDNLDEYDALIDQLRRTVHLRPPFTRDEMNER